MTFARLQFLIDSSVSNASTVYFTMRKKIGRVYVSRRCVELRYFIINYVNVGNNFLTVRSGQSAHNTTQNYDRTRTDCCCLLLLVVRPFSSRTTITSIREE